MVHGNICVVCKTIIQSEDDFVIHSQQHLATSSNNSTPSSNTNNHNNNNSNSNNNGANSMPCIVCRQTIGSLLELRLHARHHLQLPDHRSSPGGPQPVPAATAPPPLLPAGSPQSAAAAAAAAAVVSAVLQMRSAAAVAAAGLAGQQPFICGVCLGRFDSIESLVPRPSSGCVGSSSGYSLVCLACHERLSSSAIISGGTTPTYQVFIDLNLIFSRFLSHHCGTYFF